MTTTDNHPAIGVLTQGIALGHYDADLDDIVHAVKTRKAAKAMAMKVGDRVRLSDLVRPKYLAGLPGVIAGKNLRRGKATFTMEVDEAAITRQIIESRYLTGGCISGPADLFELIEED